VLPTVPEIWTPLEVSDTRTLVTRTPDPDFTVVRSPGRVGGVAQPSAKKRRASRIDPMEKLRAEIVFME
jgi:hypothetical protein